MNKAKLIKNRLTVVWQGVTKIAPMSNEELFCSRWKQRENKKIINHKKHVNNECGA